MEISSVTRCSRMRSSTPSYRPQIRASWGCPAEFIRGFLVEHPPLGSQQDHRADGWSPQDASTAENNGSTFITMPPPPP